jgi:hypothetical protein
VLRSSFAIARFPSVPRPIAQHFGKKVWRNTTPCPEMSHFSRFFRKNGTFTSLQNPQPIAAQVLTPVCPKTARQTDETFETWMGQKMSHRRPIVVPATEHERIRSRASSPL